MRAATSDDAKRAQVEVTDPLVADRTFKNCLMLPADANLLALLTPLADLAVKSMTENVAVGNEPWMVQWRCLSLALLGRVLFFVWPLLLVQWLQHRSRDHDCVLKSPLAFRAGLVAWLAFTWAVWGVQQGATFIYFQF